MNKEMKSDSKKGRYNEKEDKIRMLTKEEERVWKTKRRPCRVEKRQ